jgi:hypothetical protein
MKNILSIFLKLFFFITVTTYSIDIYCQPAGFGSTVNSVISTPNSVIQNVNPTIVGSIKNTSLSTNGYNGEATFDIIAKITYPNSSTVQYVWDNQSFTFNQTKSFTYPSGNFATAATGNYSVAYTVYTNDRGYTYQSKSTNFTVTAAKPDLIIKQYPTLSSSSVLAGNSVTVYYNVINQGNATAGSSSTSLHLSSKNYYDATAAYLTDITASSLSAGSSQSYSKSITIPASTPAGNYYILVSADGGLAITESNESNQTTYVAITVTVAKPDLIIKQYPTLSSSSVLAGNSVTVYYNVINQGNATAASSSTSLHLSSKNYYDATAAYLTDNTASSLSAGSSQSYSKSITIPASTPAGNYYILVSADGGLAITESNESNQTTYVAMTVTVSKPDLIIKQYPTLSSSSVFAGNSVTVYYDVINQGNATAGSSSTSLHLSSKNYYDATATYLTDITATSLSAGNSQSYSKSITIPASTPAGNYYILVSADGGLAVTESNESNQTTYVAITVTVVKPDLIIKQYPTLSSSSVLAGSSVTVYYNVINQGNATAGSSSTSLHLSSKNYYDATATYLTDITASSLSSGSSQSYSKSITIPASTPAGNYYILVSADGGLAVAESNEVNQTTYVAITVSNQNSISISSSNIPTWQREGDDFSGSITVDLSKAGTNPYWHLEVDYFNSNGYQGAIIYPSLSASTKTQNFSTATNSQLKAQTKQGNYFTWNVVLESNNAHSSATQQTKIIDKKLDNMNVFYYNKSGRTLKLPLKYIDGAESVRIVFSLDENTSKCLFCPVNTFDRLKLNESNSNAIYSIQVNKINSGYFAELPISNIPSNSNYKVSINLNYNTSNIGSKEARPGEYFYAIDYLKSNGTNNLFHEEGKFDLTKFGSLGDTINNDTTIIFVGGNRNLIEEDFQNLNITPAMDANFSIANNFRYGKIGVINAKYNTWYIGQGNTNSIQNNAYDIGVALDSIVKLTTPKEIHLIGHSFGGIQIRTMMGKGGRKMNGSYTIPTQTTVDKIKTATFLSSPHRGIAVGSWSLIDGNAADEMKDDSYFVKTTLKYFTVPNQIKIINVTSVNTDLINPSDGVVDVSSSAKPELISSLGTNKMINQYYVKKFYPQIFVWNALNAHSMTHHTDITSDQTLCSSENINDKDFSVLNRIFYHIRGGNNSNTDVQEISANSSVKLYPNPVMNELFIKSKMQISQVAIYTLEGIQVKIIPNYIFNTKIELSDLSKGVYLVRVSDLDNNIFIGKFIKE